MGKNHLANFDKTDYGTLPITFISLYLALLFHGHAKKTVSGPYSRSWSKTRNHLESTLNPLRKHRPILALHFCIKGL